MLCLCLIYDTLELVYCFLKLHHLIFVGDFLGQQVSTAERRKIALLCHVLLVRLGKEEIDRVVEIRTFVEVPFGGPGKEAQAAISELSLIVFLNEPVLLVYDAIIG